MSRLMLRFEARLKAASKESGRSGKTELTFDFYVSPLPPSLFLSFSPPRVSRSHRGEKSRCVAWKAHVVSRRRSFSSGSDDLASFAFLGCAKIGAPIFFAALTLPSSAKGCDFYGPTLPRDVDL